MNDLLKLLPQLLRHSGDSEEARQQAVFAAWAGSVGALVRRVTAPVKLERKTLIVAVPDSTWRAQLKNISGQALFRLNSLLGAPVVTAIDFVVNPDIIKQNSNLPHEVKFIAPDEQALPLREKAAEIADPDLRETFLRAAGKCLERRAR